ncbi:MAG: hypothetical protein BGN88_06600 [Clostridiales bacterium 43-6]|nr:MAG: hypothetical protein BGN88_06600 [Clostridiales bacterium 43-6]
MFEWQDKWDAVVDKGCSDYSSLTKEERICFNIRCLIDAVNNGGIISYYYNSGADYWIETVADLKSLGLGKAAELILKVNALFPNQKPSLDLEERNNQFDEFEEDDEKIEELLDYVDTSFYEMQDEIEAVFEAYITKT